MVWRVCRSLVCDDFDAEDAFQATFLVLVRKAGSLKVPSSLGPWLYSVAYRVGLNTRSIAARQTAIRRSEATRLAGAGRGDAREPDPDPESLALPIHQEIMRLPEVFRIALLLCDIDGLSYRKAAETLNVPLGTLQSRLPRPSPVARSITAQRYHIGQFGPATGFAAIPRRDFASPASPSFRLRQPILS